MSDAPQYVGFDTTLQERLSSLKLACDYGAKQLTSRHRGRWMKLGVTPLADGSESADETDASKIDELKELFSRKDLEFWYTEFLTGSADVTPRQLMPIKLQSDALSAMQNATALRYRMTRMRAICATAARLESLNSKDIDASARELALSGGDLLSPAAVGGGTTGWPDNTPATPENPYPGSPTWPEGVPGNPKNPGTFY